MTTKDVSRSVTVAQVMDALKSLPKAHAAGEAAKLYDAEGLNCIADKVLRRSIAVALADYFKNISHPALPRARAVWETWR